MQLSNAPTQIVLPFAADDSAKTNPLPVASQQGITPGAASYTDGFPPLCAVDPSAGGVGPSKADMNGALYAMSAIDLWVSAGGVFVYNAAFQTAIGGYPKGALLQQASGGGLWMSLADNNMSDPDTGGGGWVNINTGSVLRMSASVYASTQQTIAVGESKILFDTVEFDGSGLWDAADKRFVATVAGNYRVTGNVILPGPAPQGSFISTIHKNGALAKQCFITSQVSNTGLSMSYDAIISCAVGDYIELFLVVPETAVTTPFADNQPFVYAQIEYLGT